MSTTKRHIFLSHASEDKNEFVRPFAAALEEAGISFWFDEAAISWGDRITSKIDEGLRNSEYVIVFLSDSFLGKNWPEAELGSALNRENTDGKTVVLPLILGSPETILERYPLLRDKAYLKWSDPPSRIVETLKAMIHGESPPPSAGNLFAAWSKSMRDEGKPDTAIFDFLDSVAEEATTIANHVSKMATAAHKGEDVDLSDLFMLTQECQALTHFRRHSPSVVGTDESLANVLVARLATYDLAPGWLRETYWSLLLDDERYEYSDRAPDLETIRDAVIKLNEGAGELRALAKAYRAGGQPLPPTDSNAKA